MSYVNIYVIFRKLINFDFRFVKNKNYIGLIKTEIKFT
jgi:hypothetical protein